MREAERITKDDVMSLLAMRSPKGILSVYVGLHESDRHDAGRWRTAVRSALNKLAQTHANDKDALAVIQTAQTEITGFPVEARHRSLAYFRSLDPDWRLWRSVQHSLEDSCAWDQIPQVRPLVALLDESPLLGVAVASQERIRLFTWRDGTIEELADLLAEQMVEESRTPSAAPVSAAAPSGTAAIPKKRAEDRIRRFLQVAGRKINDVAGERGWQRLLLIGPAGVLAGVTDGLPDAGRRLLVSPLERNLIKASNAEILDAASRQLHTWKRQVEATEVEELINEARSGGRACLGVQATLDHLHQRRIERLVFCADLQMSGFRDGNGRLYERLTDTKVTGSIVPALHLIERMIADALESGATVVPLEGESSRKLSLLGGVGARLRWKGADRGLFPEGRRV